MMVPLMVAAPTASKCITDHEVTAFPVSRNLFSSAFQQPEPPLIGDEFKANWNQHKWDPNVSHIASGYIYNSPSNQKVRADVTSDSGFASSLFDYTNISSEGLVSNTLYNLEPCIAAPPQLWQGYVNPTFPLFSTDILVTSNAVFGGIVDDQFNGKVASWNIMYGGGIPVTVYLDACNTLVGWDSFINGSRTRIITRFFNIVIGKLDPKYFCFPMQA
ncbi:hypothetical protein H2199_006355 [Coniosporium tulheliwenetii]|uniref:Uncharacterized protein n=1 Tax=Coniosporium tulheliwenetii TaxID=3383036 RepID=A0ACC2YWE5_9PEZI|nr:hypothetical protein H2199_006355 [Cladosporium sp. JES 115]